MTADPQRVEELFQEIIALPPADRDQRLQQECGQDEELRERIECLLKEHGNPENIADGSAEPLPATVGSEATQISGETFQVGADTVINSRYTLKQKIGEGGMGEVWVAQQSEPVKRKVAVKLIKLGMDSKAVITRFEQERQALALMDHPHIARVLDGGLTAGGQPFFVMELVNGLPLAAFCDEMRLTPQERLTLFLPICNAVQHAHQKGIIHRDLKPANILVTLVNGEPVPKVIDFGVAKATGGKLTEETLATLFGTVVGTLEYMSPEQAGFSDSDADTRADIYSLGVILYELLTGLRPLEGSQLKQAKLPEKIRLIQNQEPSKPSTRLSSDASLPTLAAARKTDPHRLMVLLKGELDWVVMKCLEKDRERRYQTANGLAQDIQRYLRNEPVEARPPSTGYRLRKFIQRNQLAVIASSLVLLALVVGITGTTWGLFEAIRQEGIARQALTEKDDALRAEAERAEGERRAKEEAQRAADAERDAKLAAQVAAGNEKAANERAQKRLQQIEKANRILASIFDNLDPEQIAKNERPLQAILVENLEHAIELLEGEAIGDPMVVASMQSRFAVSLMGLGEPDKAIVLLQKSLATWQAEKGPRSSGTLTAMNNLALAYKYAGKLDQSLTLFEETYDLMKSELGAEHPSTLSCMSNLASVYQAAGKPKLVLPLFEQTLRLRKKMLGPEHPDTLTSINNLAFAYRANGQVELALPLFEETLRLRNEKLGREHPDTLTSMNNLASAYQTANQQDRAVPLFEETLKLSTGILGREHPFTLRVMNNLGWTYQQTGDHQRALSMMREALRLRKSNLGPDHPDTMATMANLAWTYQKLGEESLAVPLMEETLRLRTEKLGRDHPDTLRSVGNLASSYQAIGKEDQALALWEETLRLKTETLGSEHPSTLSSMNDLAVAYRAAGKLDLALPLIQATLQHRKSKLGLEHPQTASSMAALGIMMLDLESYQQAESVLRQCLEIRTKIMPDDWLRFNTETMLGGALLGQKKYDEAESLLIDGYNGMKARKKALTVGRKARVTEALQRLIALYEATDQPEQVAKWQKELESQQAAE
ncbi:MAG: tetratricopeptide repeat protein [Pirellulales bacterium]|nr:tetratricopeptide repeat protein [Pirellulales bacterium]